MVSVWVRVVVVFEVLVVPVVDVEIENTSLFVTE